jgi:RNA polymerase sigma-70 factor (ECF subfamily)
LFEHLTRFVVSLDEEMPDYLDTAEPVLVGLAQNGDEHALEVLLRRYYRPLRGFITPMVGSSHADDVLQEIALAIFQNLRYLRHPAAFRSWAFRIASRRAFRHLTRETRWKLLENDPDLISSLPAPEPLPETLDPGLLAVIDQVSPASRAVLLLHYQQDLSIEETAMVLDIPVGTAKSRLAYGVSILRKRLNQKGTR